MPELSNRIRNVTADGSDGWELHYRAQAMRRAGENVIMLSVGDHDIKTDREVLQAMQASAEGGNLGYTPVPGSRALRQAIADRVTRRTATPAGPENVIVTSGGQGAIFAAMTAALDPGDACVLLDPFYASFDVTVRAVAAEPIVVPTRADDGFQPDAAAIEAALTPRTRAILINTPNNPTGAVYTRERLEAVAELCVSHDLWLISDELYDSQVHDGTHVSPRDMPGMAERTFQIGSMSKGYAMTGARCGWAVAPEDTVAKLIDLAGATTYGLPGFIMDAASFALTEYPQQEAEVAARYKRRRDLCVAELSGQPGLRVSPPEGGMYIMLDVRETGLSGDAFGNLLLDEEKIGVMPGESFGQAAAGHIRIAMTVADEALEDAMHRIAGLAARLTRDKVRAAQGIAAR
ncbi:MAG: aminotransferase class I/II-fold pyridoxal phosphate-dependent enzyme [Pseudomonadota bacterium]